MILEPPFVQSYCFVVSNLNYYSLLIGTLESLLKYKQQTEMTLGFSFQKRYTKIDYFRYNSWHS